EIQHVQLRDVAHVDHEIRGKDPILQEQHQIGATAENLGLAPVLGKEPNRLFEIGGSQIGEFFHGVPVLTTSLGVLVREHIIATDGRNANDYTGGNSSDMG